MQTLLIVIFSLFLCLTTSIQAQWVKINEVDMNNFYDAAFIDASTGVFTGEQGKLYRTTNGGEDFDEIQTTSSSILTGVQFTSDKIGYVVGNCWFPHDNCYTGIIYKTTDGGFTWDSIYFSNEQLINIYFTSDDVGYVMGNSTLLKTQDGGESFVQLDFPLSVTNPYKIIFTSEDTGYLSASGGFATSTNLYKTNDAGENWQEIFTGTGENYAVPFDFNGDIGVLAKDDGRIFITKDGGQTWDMQSDQLPGTPRNVVIHTPHSIYIVTEDDPLNPTSVYYSYNTGESWTLKQEISTTHYTQRLVIPDQKTAYLITSREVFRNDQITTVKELNATNEAHVYPNPASDFIFIENLNNKTEIRIFDQTGRKIMNNSLKVESQTIDISNLPAGIYYYQLFDQNGFIQVGKFVKK